MDYPRNLQHVAIYLRKSRSDLEAEARGEGETLEKHRRTLLEIAKKQQYVIRDVFEEIVSGERIVDRPQMQQLLHNVRDGQYTAVLCMDIDRLGRGNMIDQGLIQDAFKTSRTLIITPRKVYDLQNELDEEWSEFEAFMARRELKIITRRLRRGLMASAREGRFIARKAPYGYLKDENKRLYPDPETAPIVRMIFDWSGQGLGIVAISRLLREIGAKPPENHRGPDRWTHPTVRDILRNEAYLGKVVWNKYRHRKVNGHMKRELLPREEWIVVENAHEPIITKEQWELSQQNLSRRKPRVPINYDLVNPLAGILRCGVCGRVMGKVKHTGRQMRVCCMDRFCPTGSAILSKVEEALLTRLSELASQMPHVALAAERKNQEHAVKLAEKKIRSLEQQIELKRVQQNELHNLLEQRVYTVEMFLERSRIVGDELNNLESELARTKSELEQLRASANKQYDIIPAVAEAVRQYRITDDVETKNAILKSVVEKVIFHKEKGKGMYKPFTLDIYLRQ